MGWGWRKGVGGEGKRQRASGDADSWRGWGVGVGGRAWRADWQIILSECGDGCKGGATTVSSGSQNQNIYCPSIRLQGHLSYGARYRTENSINNILILSYWNKFFCLRFSPPS